MGVFWSFKWLQFEKRHLWGMGIWPGKIIGKRQIWQRSRQTREGSSEWNLHLNRSDLPCHHTCCHQSQFETFVGSPGPGRHSPLSSNVILIPGKEKNPPNPTQMQSSIILKKIIEKKVWCVIPAKSVLWKYAVMASGEIGFAMGIFSSWIMLSWRQELPLKWVQMISNHCKFPL